MKDARKYFELLEKEIQELKREINRLKTEIDSIKFSHELDQRITQVKLSRK